MKTLVTLLTAAALLALCAFPALATNFWTETFSYGAGGLVAVSGGNWTTYSGTVSGFNDIRDTLGVALGNNANAPDDARTFTKQDSLTGITYACMQVTIPTPATTPIVGGYFALFKDAGTFNFMGRVYALPVSGDPTHFTFGTSVYSATALGFLGVWPTALNFGQTYWVVVCYNSGAKTATLWVDPTSPSSQSVVSTTSSGTIPFVPVSGFGLRQSSSGSPVSGTVSWKYQVDNLGIGTTFYDACAFTGITPAKSSTWGQLKKVYR